MLTEAEVEFIEDVRRARAFLQGAEMEIGDEVIDLSSAVSQAEAALSILRKLLAEVA